MHSKRIRLILITALFLFYSYLAQAQSPPRIWINAPPFATGDTADIWVDFGSAPGITALQVSNGKGEVLSRKLVLVSETHLPLRVDIKKKDGSPNVFYVDAFIGADRLRDNLFGPSNKVIIKYYEDPRADGDEPGPPAPMPPGKSTQPAPPKNGDKKLAIVVNEKPKQLSDPKISLTLKSTTNEWPDDSRFFRVRDSVEDRIFETYFPLEKEKSGDPDFAPQQTINVRLHRGKNIISVALLKSDKLTSIDGFINQVELSCGVACGDTAKTARAVVGFEQIGASSSDSKMSPFMDLFFDAPLGRSSRPLSLWSQIRLSSIPVQTLTGFGNITGFSTALLDSTKTPNELTQSFDFTFGLEKRITRFGKFAPGLLPGRTAVSLILGVGAINPLTFSQTAQIFKVPENNDAFNELFPEAKGKKNIAFVGPNRIRFYRQYFGGFRIRTNFYDDDGRTRADVFPALVDITAGQSEAITGRLQGVILRAQGSTPLPILGGDFLSIFGSLQMRMGKNRNQSFLFLEPAGGKVDLFDPTTVVVPIDKNPNTISNRDIFKIGIGVDLFRLFKPESKP
jgi:hypothetical protein